MTEAKACAACGGEMGKDNACTVCGWVDHKAAAAKPEKPAAKKKAAAKKPAG